MSNISVQIDNRIRLVSSVLAASDWPEQEQAQEPHAVHAQAKMTRQYVNDFSDHPAVTTANQFLTGDPPLVDLFTAAANSSWPLFDPQGDLPSTLSDGHWLDDLADFYTDTAIAAFFWAEHDAVWLEAAGDLEAIFRADQLIPFLAKLQGRPLEKTVSIMPNLLYPSLQSVITAANGTLFLILPPPRAVGESPPWSYREDTAWVLAESCLSLSGFVLRDELKQMTKEDRALLLQAAVVLFLRETAGEDEAIAYQVGKKRQFPGLPAAAEALDSYLQVPDRGSIADLTI